MESRDPDASDGKTCDCLAVTGRSGISNSAVWVACIVSLFGRRTWMPFGVGLRLERGTSTWM